MENMAISLETLYRKFGENLKYGKIKKTVDGKQEYFDLYSDGKLVCMDGETCGVINKGDNSILVKNVNGETDGSFLLSVEEFNIGCFK